MAGEGVASRGTVARPMIAEKKLAQKSRLLYIDNMRVGLITLVVVGHMAITYGAPIGDWYYHEAGEVGSGFAIITMLLLGIGAAFLLGLFYMIASYFTARSCDRKGPWNFILDRFIRLGIPLVVYAVVINPLVTYWAAVKGGYVGTYWEYIPSHLPDLQNASVGPLWFVETLLVFSVLYALGRVVSRMGSSNAQLTKEKIQIPGNRSIILFALGLGMVTFVTRIWAPVGWLWEPPHQELAHFPQYIAFFVVGIFAYRNDWFTRISAYQAKFWGWAALALVPLLPVLAIAAGALSGEMNSDAAGGLNWLSLAYSFWEAFMGVAMVITTLVWFRDRFDRQGRLLGGMSAAAYSVYVLHPLVIVPLATSFSSVQLGLSLKFILVAPLAVVLCFLVGYLVRLIPAVNKIL